MFAYNPELRKVAPLVYNSDNGAEHGTSVDVFYNGVNHYHAVRPNPDPRQNRRRFWEEPAPISIPCTWTA